MKILFKKCRKSSSFLLGQDIKRCLNFQFAFAHDQSVTVFMTFESLRGNGLEEKKQCSVNINFCHDLKSTDICDILVKVNFQRFYQSQINLDGYSYWQDLNGNFTQKGWNEKKKEHFLGTLPVHIIKQNTEMY